MLDVVGVPLGRPQYLLDSPAVPVKLPDKLPCGVVSQETPVGQDEIHETTVPVDIGDSDASQLSRKAVTIHLLAVSKVVGLDEPI